MYDAGVAGLEYEDSSQVGRWLKGASDEAKKS